MKIIYIANIRLPTEKAHGIQIMKMCEAFSEQGTSVELIVPRRLNNLKEDAFLYYSVDNIFKIKKLPNIDLVRFGKWGFLLQTLSFAEVATWFIFWKKVRGDKRIIYTREELVAFYLSNLGINVVWEAHTGKNNFIIRSLVRRGVKIVGISKGVVDFYKNLGAQEKNLLVAHDGVDIDQFDVSVFRKDARDKLALPLDKKLVLYTGHLYSWKGAHILAEAAKRFGDETQFIFVGGTDKDIEKFKESFGSVMNIRILGRVPHSEIPIYLKSADLLVIPNSGKEDISRYYTSPLKLFEYMASGVPIIASDLPSIREILNGENSYLFVSDKVDDLADKINEVFADDVHRNIKAENAKQDVKKYTWEKRAKKITDFVSF